MCGKLDLDTVVGKDNKRSLEYYIEPSEQNHEMLFPWIEKCGLCQLVYDLEQYWFKQGDNMQGMKYDGYNYRFACGRNGSAPLHLEILADWGESRWTFVKIDVRLTPLSRLDSFLIDRMVAIAVHADPRSETSIRRMRHWVARCDANDAKCKAPKTALPTRVLDVSDQEIVTLCETSGQSGAYVALSHCWGLSDKTFLTTHDTIKQMKAGFAIGQAPATFRDAISITRLLGFRYLWIDSLSIIQRDTADWRREAAKMGSVYNNASLTIAAANAEDDNDGFLQPRNDALTSLRIISSTEKSAQVYLQTQDNGIKVHAYNVEEPLDARGWALQEQRLSRRSLRYGSTEMLWDCQCFRLHESQTDHYNGLSTSMELLKPYSTAFSPLSYSRWYTMVFLFTKRALKYDTDKLPSLLGLATEVAKFQNGTYYAGLWWEDMASGMLWFRGIAELNMPSTYLAPSWSWASLNGPSLIYEDQPAKIILPNAVFRECYVDKSDDTDRASKPGWLDVSAPIVKLIQRDVPDRWMSNDYDLDRAFRFAHLDVPDVERNDIGDGVEGWSFRRSTKGNYETRSVFDLAHKDRTEILGLFLMFSYDKAGSSMDDGDGISSQTAQQYSSNWSSLYGILVEHSPKRLPCKRLPFKRVGYFKSERLEAGEASQILEGAEVQEIRLY